MLIFGFSFLLIYRKMKINFGICMIWFILVLLGRDNIGRDFFKSYFMCMIFYFGNNFVLVIIRCRLWFGVLML